MPLQDLLQNRFAYLLLLCLSPTLYAQSWRTLRPGLEYSVLQPSKTNIWGKIHVFRIDPRYFHLELALAADQQKQTSSARSLALANRGLIAINGGFFTPELKPIGLRIKNGIVRQRMQHTRWWGIFYIKNNKPYLVAPRYYRKQKGIQFALQSGPRLVVNGRIPRLKPGFAARSALGITRDHKILLLATEKLVLTTTELAQIMQAPPQSNGLNCEYALNLDGGNSTQVYAHVDRLYLDVRGYANITDAVVVVPSKH